MGWLTAAILSTLVGLAAIDVLENSNASPLVETPVIGATAIAIGQLADRGTNNYQDSCQNTIIIRSTGDLYLCSECSDGKDTWAPTVLSLNKCILNVDGVMGPLLHGQAFETCRNCVLQGTILTCYCRTKDWKNMLSSSIDLSDVVANRIGILSCGSLPGSPIATCPKNIS
jgi:hypothetical protein